MNAPIDLDSIERRVLLERIAYLEASLTAANLRALELQTQRDVTLDERDAAIARAQKLGALGGSNLRREVMQASVELLDFAHTMDPRAPLKAAAARHRSKKLVEALR